MTARKQTILSLVGARPQFVKLAPLARRLAKKYHHLIIHSGQHYDYGMSETFFNQLHIPSPDVNLNIGSGHHGRQTGRILEQFERELLSARPDMVLVYGDTNTTLAGALAAAKLHIPVGHIESGLRSFNKAMPEEINRLMTDHVSDLLFYPTPTARANLKAEGIKKGLVNSGDLMYEILDECTMLPEFDEPHLASYNLTEREFYFVTLHRAENVDEKKRLERFVAILAALDKPALFSVHPRTKKNLSRFSLLTHIKHLDHVIMTPPLPYIETLSILSQAKAVLTDSGGIQKEAYFLGCPCLTLRNETEWLETVKTGANTLVDMSLERVKKAVKKAATSRRRLGYAVRGKKPSEIIAEAIGAFIAEKQ